MCGVIKIGYSITHKKCVKMNWAGLDESQFAYGSELTNEIRLYINNKIYRKMMTLDETIDILKLDVDRFDWDWKE